MPANLIDDHGGGAGDGNVGSQCGGPYQDAAGNIWAIARRWSPGGDAAGTGTIYAYKSADTIAWTAIESPIVAVTEMALVSTYDAASDSIYVWMGVNIFGNGDVYVVDCAAGTWTHLDAAPESFTHMGGIVVRSDGSLVLWGEGTAGESGYSRPAYATYDGSWTMHDPAFTTGDSFTIGTFQLDKSAVLTSDDRVFLFYKISGGVSSAWALTLNASNILSEPVELGTWNNDATGVDHWSATYDEANSQVLVVFGGGAGDVESSAWYADDSDSPTWTMIEPLSDDDHYPALTVKGTKVLGYYAPSDADIYLVKTPDNGEYEWATAEKEVTASYTNPIVLSAVNGVPGALYTSLFGNSPGETVGGLYYIIEDAITLFHRTGESHLLSVSTDDEF